MQLPNEEYEMQFFRFLPSSVMEGIVRLIEDRMSDAMDEVEENLSKVPDSLLSYQELQSGMTRLRSSTTRQTSKILTKLQQHMMGEVLKLPSYLLLPPDLEQSQPASLKDLEHLESELDDLHKQLSNELFFQAALKVELQEGRQVLKQQDQVLQEVLTAEAAHACESMDDNLRFLRANTAEQVQTVLQLQEHVATVEALADKDDLDLSLVPDRIATLETRLLE